MFKKIAGLAAALAVSGVAFLGLAGTAQAATMTAFLYIVDRGTFCDVNLTGYLSMPYALADELIRQGAVVEIEIWGDDSYDNLQYRAPNAELAANTINGPSLNYYSNQTVPCSRLNEDSGRYEGAGDEIYGKAVFKSVAFNQTKTSNVVHGTY